MQIKQKNIVIGQNNILIDQMKNMNKIKKFKMIFNRIKQRKNKIINKIMNRMKLIIFKNKKNYNKMILIMIN